MTYDGFNVDLRCIQMMTKLASHLHSRALLRRHNVVFKRTDMEFFGRMLCSASSQYVS